MSPVLMSSTYFWTFCPYNVIIAGDVVAWLLLSLSWEPNGSRVLGTLVRPGPKNLVMAKKRWRNVVSPMLHGVEPGPRPDVFLQQFLVWTFLGPLLPAERVLYLPILSVTQKTLFD